MKRHYLYLLLFNFIILTYLFFNIQFVYACTGANQRPLAGAPCESAVCGGGTVSGVWQRYIEYSDSPEYYGSCVQLEYFPTSSCDIFGTRASNPCSATCDEDSDCGLGICASGSQSAATVCSGDRGPTPWWCQGYNCGYQCNSSYQCVQAPVGGGVYGPASTCQQFCVPPTSAPPTSAPTSVPTPVPGQPTSTPAPTPTTAPAATWSGSCASPTSFQINGPSAILTHAYYGSGGFAWRGAAGGTTPTVNSNQNFSWYSEDCGAGCETFRGSFTCYTPNNTLAPVINLPGGIYNCDPVSMDAVFKFSDGTAYDGTGLTSGLPIYTLTVSPCSWQFCGDTRECGSASLPSASYRTTLYGNYSNPQHFSWGGGDPKQCIADCTGSSRWCIRGLVGEDANSYNPNNWRLIWPQFPTAFLVSSQIGGTGQGPLDYPGKCCGNIEDADDRDYCYGQKRAANICTDSMWPLRDEVGFHFGPNVSLCAKGWAPVNYFTVQPPVTLTVSKSGLGTVTSNIGGINCGSTCQSTGLYKRSVNPTSNTAVTLTATPNSGYQFGSWADCDSSSGNTCVVYMHKTRTVTVVFNPTPTPIPTFEVRVSVTGGGLVTGGEQAGPTIINCTSFPSSPCSASFVNNRTVTLTANSINNTNFTGWGGDGSCSGTNTTCSFTMTRDRTVTATFVPWLPPWMKVSGDVHTNR